MGDRGMVHMGSKADGACMIVAVALNSCEQGLMHDVLLW
jgi:hypothetical protein